MKLFSIILFMGISNYMFAQHTKAFLLLFSNTPDNKDTTYYCGIVKSDAGYSFVFPEDTMIAYRQVTHKELKFDTILYKSQSVFGPYKFKKRNGKIMFKDIGRSKKFEDLYELNEAEFYSPELFSSNTDSYNILSKMLDSNAVIEGLGKKIPCYKYLQVLDYHYSKTYRIIYVNKKSLLPHRFEYYSDLTLKTLLREVFAL